MKSGRLISTPEKHVIANIIKKTIINIDATHCDGSQPDSRLSVVRPKYFVSRFMQTTHLRV